MSRFPFPFSFNALFRIRQPRFPASRKDNPVVAQERWTRAPVLENRESELESEREREREWQRGGDSGRFAP